MTTFLIFAAALALAATLLFIPALRGRVASTSPGSDTLNLIVYRQRLRELDRDLAEGLLDQPTFDKLREELARDLLDDTGVPKALAAAEGQDTRGREVVLVALCLLPLLGIGLYLGLGRPELIDAPPSVAGRHGGDGMGSVQDSLARLNERLKSSPNDVEGLLLLGRSYQAMGDLPQALATFDRAQALRSGDPDIQILRAETLARMQGDSLKGRPIELVEGVLVQHPNHTGALWLAGLSAVEQGDKARAARHWQLLKAQLSPGGPDAQQMDGYLAQLDGVAQTPAAPQIKTAAGTGRVRVRVELAPELAARTAPEDTLFVFARAAGGPPMPLAIARRKVSELPLEVTLDDTMAMSPANKLSDHAQIRIGARVSRSGQALPQPGDLQGLIGPVPAQDKAAFRIVIDQVVQGKP